MFAQIAGACLNVIVQCHDWFFELLNSCGAFTFWFCAVIVSLSYRFILAPVFGHAQSDMAKNTYRSFKNRKG